MLTLALQDGAPTTVGTGIIVIAVFFVLMLLSLWLGGSLPNPFLYYSLGVGSFVAVTLFLVLMPKRPRDQLGTPDTSVRSTPPRCPYRSS